MRPITRVAGAVLLACAALGVTASPAAAEGVTLTVQSERRAPIVGGEPGMEGRTIGYWGTFTFPDESPQGDGRGSYRATCSWLASHDGWSESNPNKRDNRILCTIVLSFRATGGAVDPLGTTLVAQGLMLRPREKHGLFTRPSARQLPITGATGGSSWDREGVIFVIEPTPGQYAIRVEFDA